MNNKAFHALLTLLVLFSLNSCQPQSTDSGDTVKPTAQNEEEPAEGGDLLGTWTRVSLSSPAYNSTDPATLILNADNTYSSATSACATSGTLVADDKTYTLTMLESGCPGGVQPPFSATYTYTIKEEDDGSLTMTTVTDVVTEVYVRNAG